MKTISCLFLKLSFILFITIILFTTSCSDDPSSPNEGKPEDVVEIGIEGGNIEKGDFTITIPAGAFDGDYNISVSEIEDDGAFGENNSDNFYEINGVPENYSSSLKIKIKYDENITSNLSWAVGKKAYDNLSGDSIVVHDLLETTDSSGYLIAYVPVMNTNNRNLNKTSFYGHPISYFVGPLLNYPTLETEHFLIKYPTSLESSVSQLGQILETIYDIANVNLELLPDIDNSIKLTVVIKIQDNTISGELDIINIKRELVNNHDFDLIKMGLLEYLIETYVFVLHVEAAKPDLYVDNYWLVSAIYSWAQKFLNLTSYKYPENFEDNALSPFAGINSLHGGDYQDIKSHGIGMSSLIEYLVEDENFGIQGLSKTYEDFFNGSDLTDALLKNKGDLLVDWFPDYFKKLISNEIYELQEDYFIDNTEISWNINNSADTIKTFNALDPLVDTYLDLSAKPFIINLNHQPIDDSYDMLLSMGGPVSENGLSLVVFGIQNGEKVHLETAHAQDFVIPNIKEYYDNNMRQFLVVLVNALGVPPYHGESNIDLKVQIGNNFEGGGGQTDLDYNLCRIEVYLQGLFEDTRWAEGTTQEAPFSVSTYHDYYDFEDTVRTISGSFYENVFTGSFDDGNGWTQTAFVTLNENHNIVLDYNYKEVYSKFGSTTERIVAGKNVPISAEKNTLFEIRGENSCSSVTSIFQTEIITGADTSRVVDHWCNDNSRVVIQFYKN